MKIARKILFSLLSVFLIWQSYLLAQSLLRSTASELNTGQLIMVAFMINLYITGIFAFPGFVFPSNRILGKAYFRIRNEKMLKRIYKLFAVNKFRFFLLFTYWGKEKNRKKYFNGTKSGLQNFIYQSLQSETGHILSFVTITICSILLLFHGYYTLMSITTLINILANLYPVILQRHHRIRIQKLTNRML